MVSSPVSPLLLPFVPSVTILSVVERDPLEWDPSRGLWERLSVLNRTFQAARKGSEHAKKKINPPFCAGNNKIRKNQRKARPKIT